MDRGYHSQNSSASDRCRVRRRGLTVPVSCSISTLSHHMLKEGITRRRLAVGLETGEILIYSSAQTSVDWRLDNVIDSR